MKKLLIISAVFMNICSVCVNAQKIQLKLNQVELMKKFIGTWQQEGPGKDTINEFEMREYNNALMQTNSSTISGIKIVQFTVTYNYDPASDNFKCFSLTPGGQLTTWRVKFSSDKEVYFERVEDLKTNKSILRNTAVFENTDHLISNNYNRDNVKTSSDKWVRTNASITSRVSEKVPSIENTVKSISFWRDSVKVVPSALLQSFEKVNEAIASFGYPDAGYKIWLIQSDSGKNIRFMVEGSWPDQEAYNTIHSNEFYKNALKDVEKFSRNLKIVSYNRFTLVK